MSRSCWTYAALLDPVLPSIALIVMDMLPWPDTAAIYAAADLFLRHKRAGASNASSVVIDDTAVFSQGLSCRACERGRGPTPRGRAWRARRGPAARSGRACRRDRDR